MLLQKSKIFPSLKFLRNGLFLLLALIAVFHGIAFFTERMFWDITLINLPWRYHLSECLNNGELPLWNPYMNYGFPQMGHYETWYPLSWIISLIFGYDLKVLQYEFLFHLWMAGVGMSVLLKYWKLNQNIRLSIALSYMFCGVFVAQASHLGYIIAGAWMPFVLFYWLSFLRTVSFKSLLGFVFFLLLLATGGYPGNTIILGYICLVILLYRAWLNRETIKTFIQKISVKLVLIIVFFLMGYALVLSTTLDIRQDITRGILEYSNEGIGAQTGSLEPAGLITLVAPTAQLSDGDVWGGNRILNDTYFGFFSILLILIYFTFKKNWNKHSGFYTITALFFLLVAVAHILPFHKWLYHSLPLLSWFRFPSLYRIFFIGVLLIFCGFILQKVRHEEIFRRRFSISVALCSLLTVTIAFIFWDGSALLDALSGSKNYLGMMSYVAIDCLIIGICGATFFALNRFTQLRFEIIFLVTVLLDIGGHAFIRSNEYVSRSENVETIDQVIAEIPDGFPLVDNQIPMRDAIKQIKHVPNLWLNRFMYAKYPIIEGASPYSTVSYSNNIMSGELDTLLTYPFASVFDDFENFKVDRSFFNQQLTAQVVNSHATPNSFSFEVKDADGKWLLLNHNQHRYWRVFQNGYENKLDMINQNYMAVQIQSNNSYVEFIFDPPYLRTLVYLSFTTFFFLAAAFAFSELKEMNWN